MKVEWDEINDRLSVNGFLISGVLLRAIAVDELLPSRPWLVTERKDGIVTCRAHSCECIKELTNAR